MKQHKIKLGMNCVSVESGSSGSPKPAPRVPPVVPQSWHPVRHYEQIIKGDGGGAGQRLASTYGIIHSVSNKDIPR